MVWPFVPNGRRQNANSSILWRAGPRETNSWSRGASRKRHKDQLRRQLRAADIHEVDWETQAQDRDNWRAAIKEGVKLFKQNRREVTEGKRRRRKEKKNQPPPSPTTGFPCPRCRRVCKARIGLHSHLRRCQQK